MDKIFWFQFCVLAVLDFETLFLGLLLQNFALGFFGFALISVCLWYLSNEQDKKEEKLRTEAKI